MGKGEKKEGDMRGEATKPVVTLTKRPAALRCLFFICRAAVRILLSQRSSIRHVTLQHSDRDQSSNDDPSLLQTLFLPHC